MSWDLYLFRKNNEPLDWNEVVNYARKQPNFTVSEDWFRYYNKATGVYCTFGLPRTSEYEEDDEYQGFPVHNADLWFNLNYLRPAYFAWESLPVVEDLTKKFDLLVFDPQNWDQAGPCPFDYEALLKTWKEGNLFALRGVDKKPPFLSPEPLRSAVEVLEKPEGLAGPNGNGSLRTCAWRCEEESWRHDIADYDAME